MIPHLLSTKEAAKFLGVAPQTLQLWRMDKTHPLPYVKFNTRLLRYRMTDLIAWVDRHVVEHEGSIGVEGV